MTTSTNNPKKMNTNEIITDINGNGGFHNFNKWEQKEIAEWVLSHYNCSRYIANSVAYLLK